MNLNTIAYAIYSLLTIFISLYVGKQFHKNGYHYILSIFEEEPLSNVINNLLLVGYYLVNIGFSIIQISYWNPISNFNQLIESISTKTATILIILATLNFINVGVLSFFRKKKLINQ